MTKDRVIISKWKTYNYHARFVKGQWLLSRTVYDYDGYYMPGLSYTNEPATEDEIESLFD